MTRTEVHVVQAIALLVVAVAAWPLGLVRFVIITAGLVVIAKAGDRLDDRV